MKTACRRWLRVVLVALLLLALAFTGWRVTLRVLINRELTAIRAQGYPVTTKELNTWYVEPIGSNHASKYQDAIGSCVWTGERYNQLSAGRLLLSSVRESIPLPPHHSTSQVQLNTVEIPVGGDPLTPEMTRSIKEILEENRVALVQVREAVASTECRFPIDLTNGYDTPLPHLTGLRRLARLLQLETILLAENGNGVQATESVQAIIRLACAIQNEPTSISRLVEIDCRQVAIRSLRRILNRTSLRADQLEALDYTLARDSGEKALKEMFGRGSVLRI